MSTILQTLRIAIKTSEKSLQQIARESDTTAGQLSRLMSGERGLGVATAEQVAEALGLKIIVRPKRQRASTTKAGDKDGQTKK